MATDAKRLAPDTAFYRESDGKPMGETPVHRDNLILLIHMLQDRYINDPMVYVSGNMFLYYERGNPRKSLVPDVFLVHGVDKYRVRGVYKTWEEEGHGPDLVIELTSPSTRREDIHHKFVLYQSTLRVREYFLFDPLDEYLKPPLQGFRLVDEVYEPIVPVAGRLPSEVVGLHFERDGEDLRLHDPETGRWIPTREEVLRSAQADRDRVVADRDQVVADRDRVSTELHRAEAEIEALRRELDALRLRDPGNS